MSGLGILLIALVLILLLIVKTGVYRSQARRIDFDGVANESK